MAAGRAAPPADAAPAEPAAAPPAAAGASSPPSRPAERRRDAGSRAARLLQRGRAAAADAADPRVADGARRRCRAPVGAAGERLRPRAAGAAGAEPGVRGGRAAATLPGAPPEPLPRRERGRRGPERRRTTPFSSSTLAELYFQQGLVDRAVDVYRQLLEQEPENEKARQRLAELESARPPVADERAARRRALERTIAGLEALLAAVQRR